MCNKASSWRSCSGNKKRAQFNLICAHNFKKFKEYKILMAMAPEMIFPINTIPREKPVVVPNCAVLNEIALNIP